jgi:penicillin-binding protein 1C
MRWKPWRCRLGLGIVAVPLAAWILLWGGLLLAPYPRERLSGTFTFPESRRIQAADGTLLREVTGADGTRAEWRPLAELSPWLPEATIAVEDARFFRHAGVDVRSVARALLQDLRHGEVVSGASTITMQLNSKPSSQP